LLRHTKHRFFKLVATLLDSLMHFTQYKTTWLAAISSHCLAALPAKIAVIACLPPDLETKV